MRHCCCVQILLEHSAWAEAAGHVPGGTEVREADLRSRRTRNRPGLRPILSINIFFITLGKGVGHLVKRKTRRGGGEVEKNGQITKKLAREKINNPAIETEAFLRQGQKKIFM